MSKLRGVSAAGQVLAKPVCGPGWHPAWRWPELVRGDEAERGNLCSDGNVKATSGRTMRVKERKRSAGAEQPVVVKKFWKQNGAKGLCNGAEFNEPTSNGRSR